MYRIGIDLGGTNIKAGVVKNGKILAKSSIKTGKNRPYGAVIKDMAEQARSLAEAAGIIPEEVESVGVGCPGAVTGKTGTVAYANNLGWRDVPLGPVLSSLMGVPVKVSNDANVAALGEALYGAGKDYRDMIMLTLGTGVGGGIIIDKRLVEGNESKGGELGHVVIRTGGRLCTCGRRGCLEAYASASALISETVKIMRKTPDSALWKIAKSVGEVNGETAFAAEKLGDPAAKKVVDEYVYYLAEGLMNFCNIFRPQAIVLGGGVSAEGKNLTDRLVALMKAGNYGYAGTPAVEVLTATLGNDAGILGAASL